MAHQYLIFVWTDVMANDDNHDWIKAVKCQEVGVYSFKTVSILRGTELCINLRDTSVYSSKSLSSVSQTPCLTIILAGKREKKVSVWSQDRRVHAAGTCSPKSKWPKIPMGCFSLCSLNQDSKGLCIVTLCHSGPRLVGSPPSPYSVFSTWGFRVCISRRREHG